MIWRDRVNQELKELRESLDMLLVEDYFSDCPSFVGGKETRLVKSEAKSFPKIGEITWLGTHCISSVDTHYTSPENYEAHKAVIKEWGKHVAAYLKYSNNE